MGLEPTTNGTTNRYSNQLSYSHREKWRKFNLNYFVKKEKYIFFLSLFFKPKLMSDGMLDSRYL